MSAETTLVQLLTDPTTVRHQIPKFYLLECLTVFVPYH